MNKMEFFDWSCFQQIPPTSQEIDLLIEEYILIAITQKFYTKDASILELYTKNEFTGIFPKQWHNYVSLICEQDVFIMDQICKKLWPSKLFSIVKYEDPKNEYWYHYTIRDSDKRIYDLQLHYMAKRQNWLLNMVPTKVYETKAEKLLLMDNHGFPWEGNHRNLYI